MKKHVLFLLFTLVSLYIYSQKLQEGQKLWSSKYKLKVEDFKMVLESKSNKAIYSQFVISHEVKGFDFLKKNLNKRVKNIFLGNSSWINKDRINSIEEQLDFQQLQFDLCEIYTRKFRKRLLINKRSISRGFDIINKISNEIITNFTKRRVELMDTTKQGTDKLEIEKWKRIIENELVELNEFSFSNKKRIKLRQ